MNWLVLLRPHAETDIAEARAWSEAQRPALGDELLDELAHTVRLLEVDPERTPVYYRGFRRKLLHRFPSKFFTGQKAPA
jgi:hypothetical protein